MTPWPRWSGLSDVGWVGTRPTSLPGSWKITYTNGVVRFYSFDKAGMMTGSVGDQRLTGRIERKAGGVILTFDEGDTLERLTLRVDNYSYPRNTGRRN
jgi:hypothetical protein